MSNRSKDRTRTGAGLSDAARPDERMGDDLEKLDETANASGASEDEDEPLLAEGETVGPWSEEDEEPNAFDAAAEEETELDEESSGDEPGGYQASSTEPPEPSRPPPPPPKRRRSH
jgi:hypothetical protein